MVIEELKIKTGAMIASVILHLLLLLFFTENENSRLPIVAMNDSEQSQFVSVTLIPAEKSEKEDLSKSINDTGDTITYPADLEICGNKTSRYIGIGVIYNPYTRTIMSAPEYYPGFRAGLRVGDFIMNLEEPEVNGYVTLRVLRDRNEYTFKIKVEKICYVNS